MCGDVHHNITNRKRKKKIAKPVSGPNGLASAAASRLSGLPRCVEGPSPSRGVCLGVVKARRVHDSIIRYTGTQEGRRSGPVDNLIDKYRHENKIRKPKIKKV